VRHGHTDDEIRAHIRHTLIAKAETWLAADDGRVVAMMALKPGWVDQLYVAPDRLGEGIGRRLLDLAKTGAGAEGLQLWTFQVNDRARQFYERNDFSVAEMTDGSNNEEREPDVRYVWRPS